MTFANYQLLSPTVQLYYVLRDGLFLARRFEAHVGFNLYHCVTPGQRWFVEVSYDEESDSLAVQRMSRGSELLEAYAHQIQLPD